VAGVVVGELYGIHSTAKCFSPIGAGDSCTGNDSISNSKSGSPPLEPLRDIRGVLNCGVLGGKRERSDDENSVVGVIFK
jgi:hypothetical protein